MEDRSWGVMDDAGKWEVYRVDEERAREAFNDIHYGKLVKNIQSGDRYTVVDEVTNPHD